MGFYGNVTNTSKTNFVFDKIYTNRKAMDENIATDGIFIGRYVLVEYGQITNDSFIRAYGPKEDGYYHTSNDQEEVTRILYTANKNKVEGRYITNGIVIYTITKNNDKDIYNYYECNGGAEDGVPAFANNPGLDPNNDPYFFNFNQDKAVQKYDTSRGYDGTVWVKTSVNNEIKYVNIAELNSVVPSFDMVADAPTMSPILPHFDTASNNVYYKLHWQPAWGMRIAETDNPERSDYKTAWSQEFYNKETGKTYTKWYNPATGEWDSDSPCEIVADIYFNYAAFDSQVGEDTIHGAVKDMNNYIGITADGLSGNEYNLHDGTSKSEQKPDTQQIHINLPAIGNMMSDAWDIIHGKKRDNSTVDSLQGRLNFFKDEIAHNEIPIQSSETEGYLVGSVINGAVSYENSTDATNQDKSVYNENILEVEINSEKQHEHDDAWIATSIDTNQGKDGDKDYHRKAISIHHTFHKRDDSTVNTLNINDYDGKNGGSEVDSDTKFQKIVNKDTIQLYVPKVDKAGHVVGTDIDQVVLPYGYKHIETIGNKINNKTTDLDTTQDRVSNDHATVTAGTPIGETAIIATETQDTVNIDPFNKWIQIKASGDKVEIAHEIHGIITKEKETDLNDGTNTITFHDLEFDAAGHVEKNQLHTYTLPFGYKKIAAENSDAVTAAPATTNTEPTANNTQDTLNLTASNKWIKFNTLDNTTNPNEIQIGHILNQNTSDANKDFGLSSDMTIQQIDDNNNQFNIPVIQFDEAGHIKKAETHKVQLPNGFTTFTSTVSNINNENSISGSAGSFSPDTMTDTITLAEGNQWINIETSEDKFTFKHYAQDFNKSSDNYDFNNSKQSSDRNSFTTTDWSKDRAGHLTAGKDTVYTLPNGIKTLSIKNSGKDNVLIETPSVGDLIADNLVDVMTIDNGNRWLGMVANNKELKLYHNAPNPLSTSGNTTSANSNNAKTIVFNSTFEIPQVKYDETGHIFAVDKHTITLDGTNSLTLNNYSKGTNKEAIATNETLNGAFGKLENRLDILQGGSTIEGSVAYQIAQIVNENANGNIDTLNEIASWIINDTSGAARMANDIAILKGTDTTSGSVKKSIKDAIAELDSSVTVSNNSNYLTGITIVDGKITGKTEGTLGSAAFTESTNYATAAQGALADTAIQSNTEFVYDKIQEDDGEGNIIEEELKTTLILMAQKIVELENEIKKIKGE